MLTQKSLMTPGCIGMISLQGSLNCLHTEYLVVGAFTSLLCWNSEIAEIMLNSKIILLKNLDQDILVDRPTIVLIMNPKEVYCFQDPYLGLNLVFYK